MLRLSIKNFSNVPIDQMTFQFRANYFGLKTLKPSHVSAIGRNS